MKTTPTRRRKRLADGEVAGRAEISLTTTDVANLDAVQKMLEEEGPAVTQSRIYSVALRILRARLAAHGPDSDAALWLFRT